MAAEKDLVIAEGGGKKKIIMIAGGALLVVVLAVVGFLMFSGGDDTPKATGGSPAAAGAGTTEGGETVGTALYVPLPRPFVFNVPGASRDRMVQIKVQLLVRGSNNETIALRHIPLIEGTLLATFSAANADELITTTGKEELKNRALIDLQNAMLDVVGTVVVAEILFTGFVMQ